jgi:hypothetical protein
VNQVTVTALDLGSSRRTRLAVAAVLVVAIAGWLGWRGFELFSPGRNLAAARAVVSAPNVITHRLPAAAAGSGVSGTLQYVPHQWLSVITLHGLAPVSGRERYLVFLHGYSGWTLAGAARPNPDGSAQVRFAAEPRPVSIYEVFVTRAADDATSIPHGAPLLHWFDPVHAPPHVRPFDPAHPAP